MNVRKQIAGVKLRGTDLRTVVILAITGALIAIGVLNLRTRVAAPLIPYDGVIWVDASQGVVADIVDPGGPAYRAGIRRNDILNGISLDGGRTFDEVTRATDVQLYLDEAGVGNPISYAIARPNAYGQMSQWAADIEGVVAHPLKLWRDIYLALIGLVYLIIGLYVLIRQRRTRYAFHFYAICLTAFVVYFYSYTGQLDRLDWVVYFVDNICLILVAPLFLHFCAVFPVKRSLLGRRPWLAALIYVPAAVMIVLEVGLATFLRSTGVEPLSLRMGLDFTEVRVQFPLSFLGGGVLLLHTFLKARSPILRQQMKWVVWGLLGIVPFTGYLIYTYLVRVPAPPALEAIAIGPLILIPLSFGYSIVRYRLMDVDVIMRRGLVNVATTALLAGLYILVLVLVSDFVEEKAPTWVTDTVIVVGTLIVAMLFAPLKSYLQLRIDRLFYGERYHARTGVSEFARMLSTITELDPLLNQVSERLQCMLSVDKIALFIKDEASTTGFRLAHTEGIERSLSLSPEFVKLLHSQTNGHQVVSLDEMGMDGELPVNLHDLRYFVPCMARDSTIAILGLGRTIEGDLLTSEDIELLRGIAPYVGIAVENSLLYREEAERAEELAHLKEFNENIIESVGVGILAVDPDGIITTWNRALEVLFGIERWRALGSQIQTVLEPALTQALRDVIGGSGWAVPDSRSIYKFRTTGHDGTELYLNVSIAPFKTKEGEKVGSLLVIEDMTQRLRLQQQLQQNEKLSSIGLLAAGVAHEVNTPLTGISSYTQMLLKQFPRTDPRHSLLEKIERQAERASTIVTNLLNFSRLETAEFANLDINEVLDDTLQLVEPQLRSRRLRLVKDYGRELPSVRGSTAKLQQVFMNLILNARDAMPGGGTLTIKTSLRDSMVGIDVVDTGVGIPPENIRRIYDPFFTTKGIGRGTGLGLALSYGIIQEHGGRIEVKSQVGDGTRFSIYLPRQPAQVSRQHPQLRLASGD